jgi:hypothetical protein
MWHVAVKTGVAVGGSISPSRVIDLLAPLQEKFKELKV